MTSNTGALQGRTVTSQPVTLPRATGCLRRDSASFPPLLPAPCGTLPCPPCPGSSAEYHRRRPAYGGRITGRERRAGTGKAVHLHRSRRPRRRPRKEQERTRILCVDVDPQTLRYVRDALTRAGYAPVVTGEPEEALRLVAEEKPPPGRQRAGDLPVRIRPGPGDSPGLRPGGRRLHRQALLPDGAGGENPGGPAAAGGPGAGGATGWRPPGARAPSLAAPPGRQGHGGARPVSGRCQDSLASVSDRYR